MYQTPQLDFAGQADRAAADGDWDLAAQLYAKTSEPIEAVLLRIVDACSSVQSVSGGVLGSSVRGEAADLRDLGIGSRLEALCHMTTYLVRKLDRIDRPFDRRAVNMKRPIQRTIVATLLVQLYASRLASETDEHEREEVRKDFRNFLTDQYRDIDFRTALTTLSRNGCYDEAWHLAILSGNVLDACELSARRRLVDQSLSLLKNPAVARDVDLLSQLVTTLANGLAPLSPKRVAVAVGRALKKDNPHFLDHSSVIHGLARVIREVGDPEKSREAYLASTGYLFDVLLEWRSGSGGAVVSGDNGIGGERNNNGMVTTVNSGSPSNGTMASTATASSQSGSGRIDRDWFNLVTFLFVLQAEYGVEAEAQRSYDVLVAPLVATSKAARGATMSALLKDTVGVILRCALLADYRRLCVHVYQALGQHEVAVELAVGVDQGLAEARVLALGRDEVTPAVRRELWIRVARASDDAVGVVERSKGVLHIEDVLTDMEPFETASERVKAAVAHSLQEHKRRANAAKAEAASALEATAFLRDDVNRVKNWHKEQRSNYHSRRRPVCLTCGHDAAPVLPTHIPPTAITTPHSLYNAPCVGPTP